MPGPTLIGTFIRENRGERGQQWLAEQLGVTHQAVSQWETGDARPTPANLLKMARLFDCDLEHIVRLAAGEDASDAA